MSIINYILLLHCNGVIIAYGKVEWTNDDYTVSHCFKVSTICYRPKNFFVPVCLLTKWQVDLLEIPTSYTGSALEKNEVESTDDRKWITN